MVDLKETQHQIEAAKVDIIDLSEHSPGGHDSITWPLGLYHVFTFLKYCNSLHHGTPIFISKD